MKIENRAKLFGAVLQRQDLVRARMDAEVAREGGGVGKPGHIEHGSRVHRGARGIVYWM